jgi:hypothetical protein
LLGVAWLPQLGQADTYDIGVNLWADPNCDLFWRDEFVVLDGGCYANKWAPNSTKGFKMNIVFFNTPARIDMREYHDDCHTQAWEKRTVTAGKDFCTPFLGSLYARFDIRFRSSTCKGQLCSNLAIAVQTFYNEAKCVGPAYAVFRYPVQGECLRAMNGTQVLQASADDGNISLIDWGGSDDCLAAEGGRMKSYSIKNNLCYPLYTTQAPMSFTWVVERTTPYAAASGASRSSPDALFMVVLLIGLRQAHIRWQRGC